MFIYMHCLIIQLLQKFLFFFINLYMSFTSELMMMVKLPLIIHAYNENAQRNQYQLLHQNFSLNSSTLLDNHFGMF